MLTIIGDIHGKSQRYLDLTNHFSHTLQLGDMGFDYSHKSQIDIKKHKFFKGNHDNYSIDTDSSGYSLGDFGPYSMGGIDFFFVRGEHSIDRTKRVPYQSWWPEEELSYPKGMGCIDSYIQCKPDLVISHGAPRSALCLFPNRGLLRDFGYGEDWSSNTSHLLQDLLEIHRPKLWIFGHFHKWKDETIDGTRFICLPELGTFSIGNWFTERKV